MKYSKIADRLESLGLDVAINKAIKDSAPAHLSNLRPISITVAQTRKGEAIRIFYRGELPEDASEYPINRIVHRHAYIYKDEDSVTFKAIKKVLKEAGREE